MSFSSFFHYPGDDGDGSDKGDEVVVLGDRSPQEWEAIRDHSELLRFAPGDVVIAHGDEDRALYIVVRGSLEATVPQAGRRSRTKRVGTIESGSVIGEMAFFDGRPRSATVRALTDVDLLRLRHEAFEVLAAKEPALARSILEDLGRTLAARLRRAQSLLSQSAD